jgi:hypothetical protein
MLLGSSHGYSEHEARFASGYNKVRSHQNPANQSSAAVADGKKLAHLP